MNIKFGELNFKKQDLLTICSDCEGVYIGNNEEGKDDEKNWLSRKENLHKYNQLIINHDIEFSRKSLSHSLCPYCIGKYSIGGDYE